MPFGQQYVDLVNNKKEEIIQSRAHVEVAIGFVSIIGIFLKLNSILTPVIIGKWSELDIHLILI